MHTRGLPAGAHTFAAQWWGFPLVTTVHGRQLTHFSRKPVKAFGDKALGGVRGYSGRILFKN